MKTKIYIFIILILTLNIFSVNAANYGGDLKIKVDQRPFNLNPIYAANDTALMINKQIFDTLVTYNNQGGLSSNLTAFWEINTDSTIFEFQLKENIYFHPYKIEGEEVKLDKRKVNAEDWKWSFEYLASPNNKSPYAELLDKVKGYAEYRQGKSEEITGIRVRDKHHLEIELKESYAPFIYNLAKSAAVVMPAEAVQDRKVKFSTAPVGTGAFKFNSFSKNRVILLKNDNFWRNNYQEEEQPYLNQIEINFAVENNLKENLDDFDLYQLNSSEFLTYQQQKDKYSNYQIKKILDNSVYFLAFNYNSKLRQDLNFDALKKKLKNTLNEDDFIDNFIFSVDKINSQHFLHNLSKSFQNSADTDFINSLKDFNLAINDSDTNIQAAQHIKNELKTADINLEIKKYSWTEYLNRLNNGDLNCHLFIMSADYNNRFEFILDNFYSTSKDNYFGYQNKRLDNLIDYLKLVNNKQSQNQAFKIIETILINDNPLLVLLQGTDNYLVSKKVAEQEIFKNMYLKDELELLYFE